MSGQHLAFPTPSPSLVEEGIRLLSDKEYLTHVMDQYIALLPPLSEETTTGATANAEETVGMAPTLDVAWYVPSQDATGQGVSGQGVSGQEAPGYNCLSPVDSIAVGQQPPAVVDETNGQMPSPPMSHPLAEQPQRRRRGRPRTRRTELERQPKPLRRLAPKPEPAEAQKDAPVRYRPY